MQNIDVRFNATSNFSKVKGDLAALEAQAASLNSTLTSRAYATAPALVDRKAWKTGSDAVNAASRAYREAASSSGLLTTQQIKATSEAERYTKSLQKQKLTIGEMLRHRGIMKEVYHDQLRYQRMSAQYWGSDTSGRAVTDITIPKNVPRDLDVMGRKIGFLGSMVSSASTQMVNLGKNIQWAGRQLTVGFTYPVVLFGAAAGMAAYQAEAGFAKINKVYDVSQESLTNMAAREKELGRLRADSMDMATMVAEKYGLTLEKTLAVEQELAATGLRGKELLSSTEEVQRISALGDIDPSQTTEMVVALQTAFRETITDSDDLTNTLNFMNAASNATSLSLQDIAEAVPRAASGFATLGGTAEEMTILLVSMREAGVDAAEGAQALKSATARILNPTILKKAQEIYAGYGAKIDTQKLSEQAEGNIFKFIQLLGEAQEANEKLTNRQKQSAVAALFGTYQFNRMTAALTNVTNAYGGVNNQTKAAIGLQKQSSDELAKLAENSRREMIENPAGQFRVEWAKFRIELAEIGDAFLEVGTKVLGVLSGVAGWFNGLDDGVKKMALLGAGLLAIAGPVIMITGLAFNLIGQFTGGIGKILKFTGALVSGFRLVNKEEQAATLTAQAQNKAYQSQSAAISTVVQELHVLAAAYREASVAAQQHLATSSGMRAGNPTGFIGPQLKPIAGTKYTPTSQEQKYMNAISPIQSPGRGSISEQLRLEQARNKMAYDYMRANNQVARDATKIQTKTAAIAKQTAFMEKHTTGASIAGTAMAGSMGAMLISSNEVVDKVAKWVLISTFVVPAVKAVVVYTNLAAKAAWSYAAGMNAGGLATLRAGGAKGALSMLGTGIMKFGKVLGPGGIVTLGIVGVTAGIMAWRNHLKKIREEQIRVSESINNITDTWAKGAGVAAKKYKEMKIAQRNFMDGEQDSESTQKSIDAYSSGAFKQTLKDFKGLSGSDQDKFALEHFLELQIRYGLTAQEAAHNIRIMYSVAGAGAAEANSKAESLLTTLGTLNKQRTANAFMTNQIGIYTGKEQGSEEAESAAKDVVDAFKNAVATAGPKVRDTLIKQFSDAAIMGWDSSIKAFSEKFAGAKDALRQAGIDTGNELRAAIKKAGSAESFLESIGIADPTHQIRDLFIEADKAEKLFFGNVSKGTDSVGLALDDNVDTLEEFIAALNGIIYPFADSVDAAEHFKSRVAAARGEAKNLENSLKTLPRSLNISVRINKTEFLSAYKTGMEATQSAMVDSASSAFDRRWDASISAAEAGNEAAEQAMSDRAERAEEAMKRRHQAALDRIKKKIDAERKADETRQRLFEAEKTRLQRLADMENKNIDFNQAINEGRLDDAAKIQNDMIASTAINAMEDEEKRAQLVSDKRIARLEKQSERLQRIQERQEAALARSNERRAAAAQAAHQRGIENMQRTRDYEKAMLDQRLELFKAYTARNQKDLEKWMKTVGLSYDDFGSSVKAKGKSWSVYFRTELASQIRLAATQIGNDKIWEAMTKSMVKGLLNGIGFADMPEFVKFINSGKLPKGFGDNSETRHAGGIVGSGGGSRGSIPNSYRGLHPSEKMIRAQKGEYVVNKTASQKHAGLLEAINSGTMENGVMGGRADGAAGAKRNILPMAGFVAGAMANMFGSGVGKAISKAVSVRRTSAGSTSSASTAPGGGFMVGPGGRHRPINAGVTSGLHGAETGFPAVDLAAPVGKPLYAVSDGVITRSYDLPGHEPRAAHGGLGYRSYGRVIQLKTNAGPEVLYAHLSRRSVTAGKKVTGGSTIGYSGNTGNSTGPHLHFGSKGASPYAWLRKGGEIRWDNTPAVLHRGERVLTAPLSRKLKDNVASGVGDRYDVTLDLRGAYIQEDVDVQKAMDEWWNKKGAKTGRKRVVK